MGRGYRLPTHGHLQFPLRCGLWRIVAVYSTLPRQEQAAFRRRGMKEGSMALTLRSFHQARAGGQEGLANGIPITVGGTTIEASTHRECGRPLLEV